MLPKIKGPSQHFNAYYHNNSVLIQFVLCEFVSTYQIAAQIKTLTQSSLETTQALEQSVRPLFQNLSLLLGSVNDHDRFSASRWAKGPLTKLKHYCEQFTKNTPFIHKRCITFYSHVHQAWLSGLHNLELLNILQQSVPGPVSLSVLMTIKRAFNHLDQCLDSIIRCFPPILGSYKDNENVLFFILKQRESLTLIYGADFINKIFKCFSQKNELPELIIQRYINRGFDHLLPIIHQSSTTETAYSS